MVERSLEKIGWSQILAEILKRPILGKDTRPA